MSGASDHHNGHPDGETAVQLQSIEQEIARLWHPDATGDRPITSLSTRSAALNLVVYAPDEDIAHRTSKATERLSQIHPSRVIIYSDSDDEIGDRPKPEIYATCDADSELTGAPCIEQIRVPVNRSLHRQLATLTHPLLIPDLPTYLWWRASIDPDDATLLNLARTADLTVVDSLEFPSIRDLLHLQRLSDLVPAGAAVADLNWHRLQPWRELTAQFFDIRQMHWALQNLREVEIDAGRWTSHALPGQVMMFVAWLSHCLGWSQFEARRTRNDRWYIGAHDRNDEHVRIIIRSRPAGDEWRGHLLSLSMSAVDPVHGTCSLSLSRSRGSSIIRMHARSGLHSTLHHAVYHPLLPDEALLMPVLEATGHDHMFDASLGRAGEIINLFGKPEAI